MICSSDSSGTIWEVLRLICLVGLTFARSTLDLSSWERLELEIDVIHGDKLVDIHVVKGRMGLCMAFGNHFTLEEIRCWVYEEYKRLKFFLLGKQKSSRNACWPREENVCFFSQFHLPPGNDIHY